MKQAALRLDARRRTVTHGGRSVALQEKSWQVLSMLMAQAPEVVSRADIIGTVWQGNFLTGEKGLNQAVWTIRVALAEDVQEPKFIRTVPRVGYQWVYANAPVGEKGVRQTLWRIVPKLAGLVAICFIAVASTDAPDMVATSAYLVDRDVHVEFANGCLLVLKNASNAEVGAPVLSSDGSEVALTLREPGACRLVTFNVTSKERREFGGCPAG